jgi:hypothetical protein
VETDVELRAQAKAGGVVNPANVKKSSFWSVSVKKSKFAKIFGVALGAVMVCAGCSSSQRDFVFTSTGAAPIPIVSLNGIVQTGGTAGARGLGGAEVQLFQATGQALAPNLVGQAVTNSDGRFSAAVTGAAPDGVYFATADLGDGVVFMSLLGEQLPSSVIINELTSVAAAYSACRLLEGEDRPGGLLPFRIAAGMSANLVNPTTGQSSQVILSSPNADQTNTLRSTRNLANALAACVDSPANTDQLLDLTTTPDGAPSSTLEALISLARHPATEVGEIFEFSERADAYGPALEEVPDAWTLAVKVNNTGSAAMPFGGAANTVFDDRGYAWINNNTVQFTTQSAMSLIVLKPDGSPADGSVPGTPVSPITGGGLLGAGYGVARNPIDGNIWVGNFGWGGLNPGPPPGGNGNGSVSEFLSDGTPVSGPNGYDGGTNRVQGIIVDPDGNVWTANVGNNEVVVFLDGDPERSVSAPLSCHPFGLAFAEDGTVWATTAGRGLPTVDAPCGDIDDSVTHWRLDGENLVMLSQTFVGQVNKGVDIDREGFVWVASGINNTIYRLNPAGEVVGEFQGGGINGPWSLRIDDAGDVWVANFGPQDGPPDIYTDAGVSVLAGPGSPSGQPIGTPLSPSTGFTLPSAGEPVLLSDGTPLSEAGINQPAFTPLMRSVSVVPDRAGNLWVSNNWKPNFVTNQFDSPGGDGMVIFVGLAGATEPGRTQ